MTTWLVLKTQFNLSLKWSQSGSIYSGIPHVDSLKRKKKKKKLFKEGFMQVYYTAPARCFVLQRITRGAWLLGHLWLKKQQQLNIIYFLTTW